MAAVGKRARQLAGIETKQAGAAREPPCATVVLGDAEDRDAWQSLTVGQRAEPAIFEPVNSAGADGPDRSVTILVYVGYLPRLHAFGRAEDAQLPAVVKDDPSLRPDPDPSAAVAEEGCEPADLLRRRDRNQPVAGDADESHRLIGEPDGSRRIDGYGVDREKAAALQRNATRGESVEADDERIGERPDIAGGILRHAVAPAGRLVNVFPAAGTDAGDLLHRERGDPHGAVPAGKDTARAKAAAGDEGHEASLAKALEPPVRRNPDVTFAILQQVPDDIREQSVLLGELLGLRTELRDDASAYARRIAHAAQTVAARADPERSRPVDEQTVRADFYFGDRSRVAGAPECVRRAGHLCHPDRAVGGLGEVGLVGHAPQRPAGIDEALRTGGAVHDAIGGLDPERVAAVEPYGSRLRAVEAPLDADVLPPTGDQSREPCFGAGHHLSAAGLGELEDGREAFVRAPRRHPAAHHVAHGASLPHDPEGAVVSAQQVPHRRVGNGVAVARDEGCEAHSVEADETGDGTEPEVAVAGLREHVDFGGRAILPNPRRVGQLMDGADRK